MLVYAVDDEHFMLEALIDSISAVIPKADLRGFRNPKELLEAQTHTPGDIVFLDIQMPEINGIELAKKILMQKEDTNIIFVTGFEQYKADAMDVYASAYIMKPATEAKVREAIKHLRYPIKESHRDCRAFTFGNFSMYVDGRPVTFHRKKSAELLAYLVDRGGSVVTRQELTLVVFDDDTYSRKAQKELDNAYRTLFEDLKAVGAENILYKGNDGIAVNRYLIQSDLYSYYEGNTQLYHGEYMEQYSWGEDFKAKHQEYSARSDG